MPSPSKTLVGRHTTHSLPPAPLTNLIVHVSPPPCPVPLPGAVGFRAGGADAHVLASLCADDEEDGRSSIRVRVDKGTLVYGDQVFYRNDAVIMTMARTDDQTFGTIQSIGASEVGGAGQHGHLHCQHENPLLTTF